MEEKKIIDIAGSGIDGQNKCPKCGATDISLNEKTGELRCNFCRHTFMAEALEDMKSGVGDLTGEQIGSGAVDIDKNAETMVTLKCSSCGAEVVVDLSESTHARCHWCRNTLSINSKVPNGAVPDVVLPFKMKKEEAKQRIEDYVGQRKFFANKRFKSEFSTENVMGVYFPYMLVDMKGHATFTGYGEHEKDSYKVTEGSGDDKTEKTVYIVEGYDVKRECDVEIDDLAVESSSRRAGASQVNETNNIINAILPFDTENCVKYDANYLKGYTSEKRDTNKSDLQEIVDSQEQEAVKFALNDTLEHYDRGVEWKSINIEKQGEKWLAAYLPVWLYSYVENAGTSKALTHYVAVNARTSETIGSVPLNKSRIGSFTAMIGAIIAAVLLGYFAWSSPGLEVKELAISVGVAAIIAFAYFSSIYNKYRNVNERHYFEEETKIELKNIQKEDNYKKKYETKDAVLLDANNRDVNIVKLDGKH